MPVLGKRTKPKHDIWITPPWVLRDLGTFDLDPCGAPDPAPWTTALKTIRLPSDGLTAPWEGRVFMNLPFSKIHPWIERMSLHGNGIALLPGRIETGWFHDFVWQKAHAVFIFRHRVNFCNMEGNVITGCDFPTILAAYGAQNAQTLGRAGLRVKMLPHVLLQ